MVCENCVLSLEQALKIFDSHIDTYNFLLAHNVLPANNTCPTCGAPATLNKTKAFWGCQRYTNINGVRTRCTYRRSIVNGTWLESNLTIQQLCKIITYYLTLAPPHQQFIMQQLGLSSRTVIKWSNRIRDALFHWCDEHQSHQIGGPGIIVEIDEAKFGHTRYQRGRRVKGQWVFGGYERGSKHIFIEPVVDRTQQTLFEIIHRRIKHDTTIISDCWPAYNRLTLEGKHCGIIFIQFYHNSVPQF